MFLYCYDDDDDDDDDDHDVISVHTMDAIIFLSMEK